MRHFITYENLTTLQQSTEMYSDFLSYMDAEDWFRVGQRSRYRIVRQWSEPV